MSTVSSTKKAALPTETQYWRSLDELAESPEFRQWAAREFPEGSSEPAGEVNRRDFVKLMSASFLLAGFGLTGCRKPEETIVPFSKLPEGYVHGKAKYFATAMPTRRNAVPLLAKSMDGRPVKLEGNKQHPLSGGGTDAFAQAAILNLYDPDRSRQFLNKGKAVSKEDSLARLAEIAEKHAQKQGRGLRLLCRESSSPTRRRLRSLFEKKLPQAKWHEYEPVSFKRSAEAASLAFGRPLAPRLHFDKAERILSLDCDFLGGEEDACIHVKGWADRRAVEKAGDTMNRLYAVEGLMTLTGSNADHRLRVPTGAVQPIAAAFLHAMLEGENLPAVGASRIASELRRKLEEQTKEIQQEDTKNWVKESLRDLNAHRGRSLVVAGYRQPLVVHLMALALNHALGNIGQTLNFVAAPQEKAAGTIGELQESLESDLVETLVILGGNPAYDAPAGMRWTDSVKKAGEVIRLGYHVDESSEGAAWHLPELHFLESWGDAQTSDGTRTAVQPLIAPLFGGLTEIELLARLLQREDSRPHTLVRDAFDAEVDDAGEEKWKTFLHDGFADGSAAPVVAVGEFQWNEVRSALANESSAPLPSREEIEVVFHRDASMDDGRFNNNGWMQELPDPITKLTWDNAVVMSRKTASELGVSNGDVVQIRIPAGGKLRNSVRGPALVQPGMADFSVGLALGYGRAKSGRIGRFKGQAVGFDVYPIRRGEGVYVVSGASISPTGRKHKLVATQDHWSMEGRAIVREANLKQFHEKPNFANNMGLEAHGEHTHGADGKPLPLYPHPYEERGSLKSEIHQWGMAIDLNRCIGCSACVAACQSENNIPIVGKEQVAKSREMHWLRIDRYYSGGPEAKVELSGLEADGEYQRQSWIDNPQVVSQPMLCQHCESAPCESVCPVNATVHDHEGLNVMAYNRCVGTRYCSNNCAWKVRRFNFFDYNKRPLEALYQGPLAKREKDDLDLAALAKNPDVSVRMRGVMEKCTFCVQRIEAAKIQRKVAARDSGEIAVPDGTIQTACEQACPAEAIVFGNTIGRPESRVSQMKANPRNYAVLGFLDTRPRTTYLAKVRNPNPEMPDYRETPLSTMEYSESMGNPFDSHGSPHIKGHHRGDQGVSTSGETEVHH